MATADALPFPMVTAPARFALALATVALVVLVDQTSGGLVDDGSHFLLMGMAVIASAWLGGVGPALLAVIAGAVFGARDAATSTQSAADMHLALFVVHGLLVTSIVAEMRHARVLVEKKAREAQHARLSAEAATRLKDEFLATISHELRTPLNAVLGWIHLIRSERLDAATARRGLASIERNVRQQAQITGDLLDVSNALTGRLRVDCRPTSLAEAAREAAEAMRTAAQAKLVELSLDLDGGPAVVLGDAVRLRQVAWHLVANAIKFTPRGGRVSIRVAASDDQARLTVSDTGPGIAPDFMPRIFDRFSQEDASPTRVAGGLGVGLSLVRELVELHGGRVQADNMPEGRGAVFTAHLPLHAAAAAPSAPPANVDLGPAAFPLQGLRVLIYDPDRDGREVLCELLRQRGAAVQTADSLADALEGLEGWRPDVLVRNGPGANAPAYSLIGKVPALDAARGGRIPALALTSFSRRDPDVRSLLAGTVRDLPKPLEPTQLIAEVARLGGRPSQAAAR